METREFVGLVVAAIVAAIQVAVVIHFYKRYRKTNDPELKEKAFEWIALFAVLWGVGPIIRKSLEVAGVEFVTSSPSGVFVLSAYLGALLTKWYLRRRRARKDLAVNTTK